MEKHEQIDSMSFDITNMCVDVQDKLVGDENEKVLVKYTTALGMTIRRYLAEFDINMYEAAGILESIKLDMLMDEENVSPDIIGCLESSKLAVLLDTSILFTPAEESELEDLDDPEDLEDWSEDWSPE